MTHQVISYKDHDIDYSHVPPNIFFLMKNPSQIKRVLSEYPKTPLPVDVIGLGISTNSFRWLYWNANTIYIWDSTSVLWYELYVHKDNILKLTIEDAITADFEIKLLSHYY